MIPQFTLERQNRQIKSQIIEEIKKVISSGTYILGNYVTAFEKKFAGFVGTKFAIGVASGTDALSLGMMALGIGVNDEVILPANAYPTAFAVPAVGAIPKLVDIDPQTFNIDPLQIKQAIGKRTKAIIVVHLYGQPADMEAIMKIGKEFNIPVIEDCAQAVGAAVRHLGGDKLSLRSSGFPDGGGIWEKVGSIGDVGCFSFYPTKNLGCFGDGGMVVTNNEEIYKKVKLLRMYGEKERYNSVLLGRNSRLDELQAAILLVKLKYLDKWNSRRREIAHIYLNHFFARPEKWLERKGGPNENFQGQITLPVEASYTKHIYHLFVIRTKKRDQLKDYLEEKGIQTAIHYPTSIHLQPSFKYLGYKKGDFPECEKACGEILSLPMFPELEDTEVEKIVEVVFNFFRK